MLARRWLWVVAGVAGAAVAARAADDVALPAGAPPRVVVCLPKGGAALGPAVERAFSWASLALVGPDSVGRRFPASSESRAVAGDERRADELLRAAETAFFALRFDAATARLDECEEVERRLPPSVRHEAMLVRLRLLRGRVAEARGDGPAAAAAFARAAETAVDVDLEEAEYPPHVRAAYQTARSRLRALPRRAAEITTLPAGAEVEVSGVFAGRTPVKVALPPLPARCFLAVTHAGYKPYLAACPAEPALAVKLEPATADGLRNQLRERLASDAAWFLEPRLLDTLAAEEGTRWIVVLDRDRARGLKALVFSAAEHALKPVEPSRLLEPELDKLSAAVRALVLRTQKLEAAVVETAAGLPALEARAADPDLGTAAAFVRRSGGSDFLRLSLTAHGAGRFSASLPLLLADEGGAWDVEYYVEAYGGGGAVACRAGGSGAGETAAPLRFRRSAGLASSAAAPARPSRWWAWMALGIAAASLTAGGIFLGTRSNDVSVTFGSRR